jgi:ligand-binding SRPBCC domain-containing protein
MRHSHFHRELRLHSTPEELFPFFADPGNLEAITPPSLHFRILSCSTESIQEGTEIDYALRIRGVPVRWRSLITAWDPPYGFDDLQLRGPYRHWHHEHRFREVDGVTLATDHVSYAMFGGSLVDRWLVRPDLERIFDYRTEQLIRLLDQPSHSALQTAS